MTYTPTDTLGAIPVAPAHQEVLSLSRAAHIKAELDSHFAEIDVAVSTPDIITWQTSVAQLGGQTRFGWSSPIAHTGPSLLIPYCPDLIAEQTADMSDSDLADYLWVIEWVCDSHCVLWADVPDADDRQRAIESELVDKHERLFYAWNAIQFRILDQVAAS